MEWCRGLWKKEALWYRLESLWLRAWSYKKELSLTDGLVCLGIAVFFSFFFYRSAWAFGPMLLVGGMFTRWRVLKRWRSLRLLHLEQFKECVLSVLSSVKAGYAVENAFEESIADMEIMYGRDCWIAEEVRMICRGIRSNRTLEETLEEMGRRSGLQEISEFAEVFAIAKRNSGNIPDTIELYSRIITQNLELIGEMETLLLTEDKIAMANGEIKVVLEVES